MLDVTKIYSLFLDYGVAMFTIGYNSACLDFNYTSEERKQNPPIAQRNQALLEQMHAMQNQMMDICQQLSK